jgi:hypothetical protein
MINIFPVGTSRSNFKERPALGIRHVDQISFRSSANSHTHPIMMSMYEPAEPSEQEEGRGEEGECTAKATLRPSFPFPLSRAALVPSAPRSPSTPCASSQRGCPTSGTSHRPQLPRQHERTPQAAIPFEGKQRPTRAIMRLSPTSEGWPDDRDRILWVWIHRHIDNACVGMPEGRLS